MWPLSEIKGDLQTCGDGKGSGLGFGGEGLGHGCPGALNWDKEKVLGFRACVMDTAQLGIKYFVAARQLRTSNCLGILIPIGSMYGPQTRALTGWGLKHVPLFGTFCI